MGLRGLCGPASIQDSGWGNSSFSQLLYAFVPYATHPCTEIPPLEFFCSYSLVCRRHSKPGQFPYTPEFPGVNSQPRVVMSGVQFVEAPA